MSAVRWVRVVAALASLSFFSAPAALWAQAAEPLASQRLGRPYVFMFVTYALVLGLIAVYVVSIAVRLARVEKRLQAD